MMQSLLRYLGLDADTKRLREEARENLNRAESQLEQLQRRLDEGSKISSKGKTALHKTLSESDFGGTRRRTVAG